MVSMQQSATQKLYKMTIIVWNDYNYQLFEWIGQNFS